MGKEEYSRNFEDQTPQVKALVQAIANVFHNGDVANTWAAILARPPLESLPPIEEPDTIAHIQLLARKRQ